MNETLKNVYRNRNRVPLVPWASRYKEIFTSCVDEVYKDVDIYIDINRPDLPVRYHMNADQLFTSIEVKAKSGKRRTVIQSCNRVVVRGQAGSGKTTFLLKLAVDWANNESRLFHKDETVILLHMKKFNHYGSLGDFIIDQLLSRKGFNCKFVEDFIEKNQKNIIILLDGYDESKRAELSEQILELFRKKYLPNVRVLVTTRPGKLNDFIKDVKDVEGEYRSLQISGFSPPKVDEYVRNVFDGRSIQAETLLKYLTDNHIKEELACLPLMCSCLCQLTKQLEMEQFQGMKTITSLMDKIIECLLDCSPRAMEEIHTSDSSFTYDMYERENYETNIQKRGTSNKNHDILLEFGKVALKGLMRSNENELIFTYSDFHEFKLQAKAIVYMGFEMGILSREYYEITIVNPDTSPAEDEETSIRFVLKIFQEKLAAMYLIHLWRCGGGEKDCFNKYLSDICASYQRATDLGNILMFTCGCSVDIAREIIHKIVNLMSDKEDELKDFISGRLRHDKWQEVQGMIELCLRLNYESQSKGALNDVLLPLLSDRFRVRLVGFSSAVSKYLGYFLAHLDGQYIKFLELRHLHSSSELSFKSYLDTFKEIKIVFKESIAKTREAKSKNVRTISEYKRRRKLYGEEDESDQIPQHLLMRMDDEVFLAVLPLWQRVNRKQLRASSIGPVVDGLDHLEHCSIEYIILDGVHGNEGDWKRLFTTMSNGAWTTLQQLAIINTHLEGKFMSNLPHALGTHPNLVHLDLSGNHIDSEFLDSLSLCPGFGKLETLILQEANMDSFSLKMLGKLVRNTPSLRTFDIKWNMEMNDEALYVIGDSLKKCTKLERLTISLYDVTKYGYKQVIEMDHFYRLVDIHFADSAKPEELLICITSIMPSMEKVQVVRISGTTGTKSEVSSHWVTSRAADLFSNAISKTPSLKRLSVLYIKFPSQSFINLLERCTEAKQSGLEGVW